MLDAIALACVGDNCVDEYEPPVGRRFAAGNAVNVAVALAAARRAVDYFGAVGDDTDGAGIVAALAAAGVGAGHVRTMAGPTSLTHIRLEGGERVFSHFAEGAAELYEISLGDVGNLAVRPLVHVVNVPGQRALLDRLVAAGTRVTCDCDDERDPAGAAGLDVAFYSLTAAEPLEAAHALAHDAVAHGARASVVMCGARGSVGCEGRETKHLAALPVEPLDTCGAGDSYIAAFIAARLAGGGLEDCMAAGTVAGAEACRRYGVLPLDDPSAVASRDRRPSPFRRSE